MPTASDVSSINIDQPLLPRNLPMALCSEELGKSSKTPNLGGKVLLLIFLEEVAI
jgi:hypothetical protein